MPRVLVEGTLCCCWGQQSPQSLCLTLSWPHGLQPTRLLCPWDFPGKNTGMSCHFLLHIWQKILIALWFGIGVLVVSAEQQPFFFFFKFECIWFFLKIIYFLVVLGLPCCRRAFSVSGGYSSLRYTGFSLWWLLLLRSTSSRQTGFSSHGMRAQ